MRPLNENDLSWTVRHIPGPVKDLLREHPGKLSLAGGFIRAMVSREDPSDIDLFSDTPEHAHQWASDLLAKAGRKMVSTVNADTVYGKGLPVQFIHRWTFAEPVDVLTSFDYTVCQSVVWFDGKEFAGICGDTFYEDLAAKRLRYTRPVRSEAAGGSMLRVLKYYQKGYRIPLPDFADIMCRVFAAVQEPPENTDPDWRRSLVLGLLREVDPLVAEATGTDRDNGGAE